MTSVRQLVTDPRTVWNRDGTRVNRESGGLKLATERRVVHLGRREFDEQGDRRISCSALSRLRESVDQLPGQTSARGRASSTIRFASVSPPQVVMYMFGPP